MAVVFVEGVVLEFVVNVAVVDDSLVRRGRVPREVKVPGPRSSEKSALAEREREWPGLGGDIGVEYGMDGGCAQRTMEGYICEFAQWNRVMPYSPQMGERPAEWKSPLLGGKEKVRKHGEQKWRRSGYARRGREERGDDDGRRRPSGFMNWGIADNDIIINGYSIGYPVLRPPLGVLQWMNGMGYPMDIQGISIGLSDSTEFPCPERDITRHITMKRVLNLVQSSPIDRGIGDLSSLRF